MDKQAAEHHQALSKVHQKVEALQQHRFNDAIAIQQKDHIILELSRDTQQSEEALADSLQQQRKLAFEIEKLQHGIKQQTQAATERQCSVMQMASKGCQKACTNLMQHLQQLFGF